MSLSKLKKTFSFILSVFVTLFYINYRRYNRCYIIWLWTIIVFSQYEMLRISILKKIFKKFYRLKCEMMITIGNVSIIFNFSTCNYIIYIEIISTLLLLNLVHRTPILLHISLVVCRYSILTFVFFFKFWPHTFPGLQFKNFLSHWTF